MILADTSIWIEHLRRGNRDLKILLEDGNIYCHPFVIGELACGYIKNRTNVINSLYELPSSTTARNEEVMLLIEKRKIMGSGIGWTDAHLISSALISKLKLWTTDRSLREVARKLKVSFEPS